MNAIVRNIKAIMLVSGTSKEPYREIERGPAYSLIEIGISGARPSFGAGIVVLFKAVYDIAKERGFAYAFAVEPAANAPPSPSGAERVATVKVFMTKDREMPLQTLLGADHSQRAQEQFDREGWMSVRHWRGCSNDARNPLRDFPY